MSSVTLNKFYHQKSDQLKLNLHIYSNGCHRNCVQLNFDYGSTHQPFANGSPNKSVF